MKLLCDIAGVSKSGYYKWLKHADEKESDHEDYMLIKEIFTKGRGKYGWRTIQMKLKDEKGVVMNHKKIQRIKIKYHLFTKIRKVNPYKAIMKKTMEHRVFENVLNREFNQPIPIYHQRLCQWRNYSLESVTTFRHEHCDEYS